MGLLDFLKVSVKGDQKPKAGSKTGPSNVVSFDGRNLPLEMITTKGFVASNMDDSLISGQRAKLSVTVNDQFGKFKIDTTVFVSDVGKGRLVAEWTILPPETEALIRKYTQLRKARS